MDESTPQLIAGRSHAKYSEPADRSDFPPDPERRRILLVEDDPELCALIPEFLTLHGFETAVLCDGAEAAGKAIDGGYDLILLDVMLPGRDGFEVLHQIRERSEIPVIMLTARSDKQDRIAGLNCGADDYLCKPFVPQELLARIKAVLRRADKPPRSSGGILRVGDIQLNPGTRTVSKGPNEIGLTSCEFDILTILMRSAGHVVSRDEITDQIYGRERTPFERTIDLHVSRMRKKIETDGRVRIRTVRGTGYIFALPEDEHA